MLNTTINGITWTIVFVPWNDPNLYRNDNTIAVGMCDSKTHTIYISDYIGGEFLKKVIVHEITHAYIFSYGLNLYKLDCEERIADIMATYGSEILATSQEIWEAL